MKSRSVGSRPDLGALGAGPLCIRLALAAIPGHISPSRSVRQYASSFFIDWQIGILSPTVATTAPGLRFALLSPPTVCCSLLYFFVFCTCEIT